MLNLKPQRIQLKPFQRRYNVILTNMHQKPMIFKIKASNVNSFLVQPNLGYLKAKTKLALLITILSKESFPQKIMIKYSFPLNTQKSIQQAWKQIKSTQQQIFNSLVQIQPPTLSLEQAEEQIVPSTFPQLEQKYQQSLTNKLIHLKKPALISKHSIKDLRLSSSGFQQYMKIVTNSNPNHKSYLSEKVIQQEGRIKTESRIRFLDEQQREELWYILRQYERKLITQINKSNRLKQQLQIAEKKIKEKRGQDLKYQIGHSIAIMCDQRHVSFSGLALLALTAFALGYIIGIY